MSDAVEIVQVGGPTVVAIAALVFAGWQQTRGFTHERDLADRAELRALLDEAAGVLTRTHGLGKAVESQLISDGATIAQASPSLVDDFKAAGQALVQNQGRLTLRLQPTSPIVKAHGRASDATEAIARHVSLLSGLGAQSLKEGYDGIKRANIQLDAARNDFTSCALAYIGVEK